MRSALRALLGAACVLALGMGAASTGAASAAWAASAPGAAPASPPASGSATVAAAPTGGGGGIRLDQPVPLGLGLGLTPADRSALAQAGAFGAHPVRLLILGDSIALTLGMGLSSGAQTGYGVAVDDHATLGCDLDPQLPVRESGTVGKATPGCDSWRSLWPFLTASAHPQVVALGVGRWEVADHRLHGHWVHVGQAAWDRHLTGDLDSAIAIFHEFGARVVLFTMPYVDPSERQPDGLPWSENQPSRVRAFNALVRQVARSHPGEVDVIDLNRMLSPDGIFTTSVDGVTVRWADGVHVTTAAGELLQRQILPQIDRIGLDDETAARAHA
jgi:SGNH domain-containing protein